MAKGKKKKELSFDKERLIQSDKYANRKDHLSVLLEDGKKYTFKQVDKILSDFMKRKEKVK